VTTRMIWKAAASSQTWRASPDTTRFSHRRPRSWVKGTLNLYIDGRADHLRLSEGPERAPLNY
jgi:hypothetical protein